MTIDLSKNKYKERDPKDTIELCKRIIEGLGFEIVIDKRRTKVGSHWCLVFLYYKGRFITLSGGKGNTEEYALASGLAEVLERLQCENLYVYKQFFAYYNKDITLIDNKFVRFPDDKKITSPEEYKNNDIVFKKMRELETDEDNLHALETIIDNNVKVTFDTFGFVPMTKYTVALTKEDKYINDLFFRDYIYGSNGFCSGNSKYEALLQGLCEILERHSKYITYRDNLCLPIIGKDILKKYKYSYSIIEEIERSGRFTVEVRDASVGLGLPVVCTVIYDRELRGYSVSYGSFPDFEIALERSLNELFQYTDLPRVDKIEYYRNYDAYNLNMTDIVIKDKTFDFTVGADGYWISQNNLDGRGIYKDRFFSEEFDFEFVPWVEPVGKSNEEMFYDTCKLVKEKLNDDVLYKDCSYLGFNSFAVVCLNMAIEESVALKRYMFKPVYDRENIEEILFGWGDVNKEDVDKYCLDKKVNFKLEMILGKPGRFDRDLGCKIYEGYLEFIKGNYKKSAAYIMQSIPEVFYDKTHLSNEDLDYWWCLVNFIGLMEDYKDTDKIKHILNKFYNKNIVETISEYTSSNRAFTDALFRDRFSEICLVDWEKFNLVAELHRKLGKLKEEYFLRSELNG